jgi:hypothetical protein
MGYPVLIATSVGMVLANAHSPWETGGPSLKTLVYRKNFRKQFAHLPQPQREVAVMRAFTRVSLEYMLTHPRHELRVLPNRVVQLFKHGHIGLEIGRPKLENGELKPVFGPGGQRLLAGYADLHFFALLALGLWGLPRLWRSPDRTAWLVPLSLAYFCFWHLLIFPAHPRYHFPMLPFLALSAASLWSGAARPAPAPETA